MFQNHLTPGAPQPILTFAINLKKRTDRKAHIIKEFNARPEFNLQVVKAFENKHGALGLWQTIQYILSHLSHLVTDEAEYLLICEDDHQFTKKYTTDFFYKCINEALSYNADMLAGGVSWFDTALKISKNLYWTNDFTGAQFLVIFKPFFKTVIEANLDGFKATDHRLSSLSNKVTFVYPFISVQKEFGYSDATINNNQKGFVDQLFRSTKKRLADFKKLDRYYHKIQSTTKIVDESVFEGIAIPTYVINLPERTERLRHIKEQFADKPEFELTIIEACKHNVGALGLWLSIRKVIDLAIANDDDVIIICEDDHQFTAHYTKEYLLKNILEAHEQGANYLSGGTARFAHAIPITANRYWVNTCLSTQFVVLYRKFFDKILDEPFDETIVADLRYSEMTSNKMVLYPFISTQRDFGYSDVTDVHNADKSLVTNLFINSAEKFEVIQQVYLAQKDGQVKPTFHYYQKILTDL